MYKIIFIDEVQDDINRFQRYVYKNKENEQFEVVGKIPMDDINELIDYIITENFDAVISDYLLSEYKSSITYTGVDLVEQLLAIKKGFPCFVMTSNDDKAVATSSDVNMVYIKGLMSGEDNVKITFLGRVKNQIIRYQKRIKNSEIEFNALIEKSNIEPLNAKEEDRLFELDTFLENTSNKQLKIPVSLKKETTLNDLHKLIANTDELLAKLDKKND